MVNLEYWEKYVTIDFKADKDGFGSSTTTWDIFNYSPYTWLDYHFTVKDLDTAEGITSFGTPNNSADFKFQSPSDKDISDGLKSQPPVYYYALNYADGIVPAFDGDKAVKSNFTLNFVIRGLKPGEDYEYKFILGQQATGAIVPLPGTLLLLGSGLLGLVGLRRKLF